MNKQATFVLHHLLVHGYITPLVANSYGISRLAARIYDLKRLGVDVENTIERSDVGVRYSRYTLPYSALPTARRLCPAIYV